MRHPLSLDFDWDSAVATNRTRTTVSDAQWNQFTREGFFVANNVIEPALLAEVERVCDDHCSAADSFLRSLPDERMLIAERGAITFAPHIAQKSPVLWEAMTTAPLVDIVTDLLGPDALLYHDQAVYKSPEKPRRFPWHQDNGYGFVTPEHYVTAWIALSDVSIDSGCVWVAPGMQREGTMVHEYIEPLGYQLFDEPPVMPVAAPVERGSAVVFSSLTPHLTGPNVSRSVRKAYIVQFVAPGAVRFEPDGRRIELDQVCRRLAG